MNNHVVEFTDIELCNMVSLVYWNTEFNYLTDSGLAMAEPIMSISCTRMWIIIFWMICLDVFKDKRKFDCQHS